MKRKKKMKKNLKGKENKIYGDKFKILIG